MALELVHVSQNRFSNRVAVWPKPTATCECRIYPNASRSVGWFFGAVTALGILRTFRSYSSSVGSSGH